MRITLLSAALLASGISSAATPINGWYAGAFGGYTYVPKNIQVFNAGLFRDETSYNGGYNAGGRIGYQSNPLRYEAEYTFLRADLSNFDINQVEQTNVSGYASGNFIMGNVYYDFPDMLPAIAPFLGVGIGYGHVETRLDSTAPNGFTSFKVNDNVFSYQGTAGITYNFAEQYAINLAYRYIATNKPEDFGRIFQAHLASAGVSYRFDCDTYK